MFFNEGHLRQYFAAFSCHMSAFMAGCSFAWPTPLMVYLTSEASEVPMTYDQLAWVVAFMELGVLITSLPTGLLADRWGRKKILLSSAVLVLIGMILTITTRSVWVLFVVRIISGMAIGITLTLGPLYVAEIAQLNLRGSLCGQNKTMANFGTLYAFCTGPFVSYQTYNYLCVIPPAVFFLWFFWAPESPYFLIMAGRRKEASESLRWLRGKSNIEEELSQLEIAVNEEMETSKGSLKDLITAAASRKALFIISTVAAVKYFGGSTALVTFSTKTFSESSLHIPPEVATILIGVLNTVISFFGAFVTDSIGRRPLLVWSSFLCGISATLLGVYFYLERRWAYQLPEVVLFISLAVFFSSVAGGINPVFPSLQAEYFPSNTRSVAGAVITQITTIFVFVSLKQYQIVDEAIGVYGNFIVYALTCFFGWVIILCYVKETAGKPMGAIQRE